MNWFFNNGTWSLFFQIDSFSALIESVEVWWKLCILFVSPPGNQKQGSSRVYRNDRSHNFVRTFVIYIISWDWAEKKASLWAEEMPRSINIFQNGRNLHANRWNILRLFEMMREWVKVCSLFCWVVLLELPVGRPGGDPNLSSEQPAGSHWKSASRRSDWRTGACGSMVWTTRGATFIVTGFPPKLKQKKHREMD